MSAARGPVLAPRLEIQASARALTLLARRALLVALLAAQAVAGLRGVVTSNGAPVANALVSVHVAYPEGQWLVVDGFALRSQTRAAASTRSDANGRFELASVFAGRAYVCASADGLAPSEQGPLDVDLRAHAELPPFELSTGGRIEGRVLEREGGALGGLLVVASRGDGRFLSARTDASGSFAIDRAAAGTWLVRVVEREPSEATGSTQTFRSSAPLPGNCTVANGGTARVELDLRSRPRLVLSMTLDGRPARFDVTLTSKSSPPIVANVLFDGSGTARLVGEAPGPHSLTVTGKIDGEVLVRFDDELELAAGDVAWSCAAKLGRVAGVREGKRNSRLRLEWQGPKKLRASIHASTDAQGAFRVAAMPAGAWLAFDQAGLDETYAGAFEVEAGVEARPRF